MEIMKVCRASGNYTKIDFAIREKITPYLYYGGEGEWVHCSEIVRARNGNRNGQLVKPPSVRKRHPTARNKGQFISLGLTFLFFTLSLIVFMYVYMTLIERRLQIEDRYL